MRTRLSIYRRLDSGSEIVIYFIMTDDPSDRDFLLEIYREFEKLMFYTASKYVHTLHEQEDIVQDSLLNLISKVALLREKKRCVLASYIVYTVRNTAFNHLKHQKIVNKNIIFLDEIENNQSVDNQFCMEDILDLTERTASLNRIWTLLSEGEQNLLAGKYILGYTNEELAQKFGCKTSSIRMMLTRARRKAQKLLLEKEAKTFDKT